MSKYRMSASIDGNNFFWIVIDKEKLIKNPTEEDLKGAKLRSYNKTNICPICRKEKKITDKSILYPKNARQIKETEEWVCKDHYGKDYQKNNPNSQHNLLKLLRDRRTGNLKDSYLIFADNCEELTCEVFGVDNLNEKNDNYLSPIDHSRHPELGTIDTKGRRFSRNFGANGGWDVVYRITEYERQYDNAIIWCANENGDIIERGYIVPKKEIDKRRAIKIYKDTIRLSWVEEYRIKDKKILENVNKIWKEILARNKK